MKAVAPLMGVCCFAATVDETSMLQLRSVPVLTDKKPNKCLKWVTNGVLDCNNKKHKKNCAATCAQTQAPAEPPEYGSVELCGDRPTSGSYCAGVNTYGCSQTGIAGMCGDLEPCCADTDKSCTDGDDRIECLIDTSPPEYGIVDACGDKALKFGGQTICSGRYGCTRSHIEQVCGSVSKACCSDADRDCANGDDAIACLDIGGSSGSNVDTNSPEPPDACGDKALKFGGQTICSGTGGYGCTQLRIEQACGSVSDACCSDTDGDCTNGDYAVACLHIVHPTDYGSVELCGDRPTSGAYCAGIDTYGCSQTGIADMCGDLVPCCADTDKSCTDGDDRIECLIDTSPPEYGIVDACGDKTLKFGGRTICSGTGRYGCTQSHIEQVCGSVSKACCSDGDEDCANGDDAVACFE